MVYMYLVRNTRAHTWTGHLIDSKCHLKVGEGKSSIWNEACLTMRKVAALRCFYPNTTPLGHNYITQCTSLCPGFSFIKTFRGSKLPSGCFATLCALYVKLCHRLYVSRSHELAVPSQPRLVKNGRRRVKSRLGNKWDVMFLIIWPPKSSSNSLVKKKKKSVAFWYREWIPLALKCSTYSFEWKIVLSSNVVGHFWKCV